MQDKIIINADDFGLSESCSLAISKAFENKLVSSTTAMANGSYIDKAYYLAEKQGFSDKVGIHIVLTEGAPLTENIKNDPFFCENGILHGKINRLKKPTAKQISFLKEEVAAQIKKLRELGFKISHADSHHHIHTDVFFIKAIEEVLKENGIFKIRPHRNLGRIAFYKKIVKNIFNAKLIKNGFITPEKMGSKEDITVEPAALKEYLCEIMVHPDFDKGGDLIDRAGFENGIPFGARLDVLSEYIKIMRPISYNEL